MSANELLTLLGLAWSRLVIYPGGLAAFALLWLVRAANRRAGLFRRRAETGASVLIRPRMPLAPYSFALSCSALAAPWLGLALLPLPAATAIGRRTDLIAVLALLEWPQLVAIAHELQPANRALRRAGVSRLIAALNSYPVFILATLALAQPAGSLEIGALARVPAETAPAALKALHWLGAAAWLLALPLLLGPFRAGEPAPSWRSPNSEMHLGLWLRACGLSALAALPWLAPFGALEEEGRYSMAALLAIFLAPFAIGGWLWCYDRFSARVSARQSAWAYLALDGVMLLALLFAAYAAL